MNASDMRTLTLISVLIAGLAGAATSKHTASTDEILAASQPGEWRLLDPESTLYMELAAGRVTIELNTRFAPLHAANIKTLVRGKFFDDQKIRRVHDNFVTQWGDGEQLARVPQAADTVAPEFQLDRPGQLPFTALPDRDGYARQSGFVDGFPAARNDRNGPVWLTHCYGMIGAARGLDPDSGNGAELYAVIGHAPRQLDRNIALVGRVIAGMELLAALPRGHEDLGFYKASESATGILSVRVAADVPAGERSPLEILRTDSPSFKALIIARRNRHDDFYLQPSGYVDVCSISVPVRRFGER